MDQAYLNIFAEKYIEKTRGSKEWTQKHRLHMADSRASAGFRFSIKEMLYPIVASRGQGAYFFDVDDNKYVDITMGYGTLLFGHSHPPIAEAIRKQIEAGVQLGPQIDKAGEVADLISNITGVERVAFCNSGTEANMTAIRLARLNTGKNKIVVFQDSYHGFYDGTLVNVTEKPGIPKPLFEGFPQSLIEDIIILPYGSLESVKALDVYKDVLAGVIVEPVRSRFPEVQPSEFLKRLREVTQRLGAVLIFDEVITGFRCHIQGAQAYFGIEADLVTYGKIIGGGLPIGIVAGKKSYMDGIDGGYWQYADKSFPVVSTTFFGGTFFKNPLSIAAAHAVLTAIKKEGPKLQNSLNEKTERLAKEINTYCDNFNLPINVVFFSSLFRFKCKGNLDIFFYHLLYKGLYVWEGKNFFLSKAHSDEDINFIKDSVLESLEDLRKANIISSKNSEQQKFLSTTSTSATVLKVKSVPTPAELKSLWLLSHFDEAGNTAYNEVVLIDLKGTLNANALHQALFKTVMRHEALRTQFSNDGEHITFLDNVDVDLKFLSPEDEEFPCDVEKFKAFVAAQVNKPFSLSEAPLYSFCLMKFSDSRHILFVTAHHTIMDGQSGDIFLNDLFRIYESIINEESDVQLNQSLHFSKLIKEKALKNINAEESKSYWTNILKSPLQPITFKTGKVRPNLKTYEGGHLTFSIGKELKEKLKHFASSNHSTLFMILLGALNILIYRYTHQKDFVVGVPASTKNSPDFKHTIGLATSVFPIRVPIESDMDFKSFLTKIRKSVFAIHDYPDFDANAIIRELNLGWDQGRASPIFDVILNMEAETTLPVCSGLNLEIIALHSPFKLLDMEYFTQGPIYLESGKAKFDLAFNFLDCKEDMIGSIEFSKDLFEEETIKKMAMHFEVLIQELIENPNNPISQVPLLTEQEKNQMLIEWNKEFTGELPDKTAQQLFEDQVAKDPTAIAVVFGVERLTYQELNQRSNQLAQYLRSQGVGPESLVAILLERSVELVVGILGILKAGGAYVSLDPSYPQGRLDYILSDSNAKWLITDNTMLGRFKDYKGALILLDDDLWRQGNLIDNLTIETKSHHLAYLIYTSGSTGKPKGTLIPHSNIIRLFTSTEHWFNFSSQDVWMLFHSTAFDVSVWEIWGALLYGGRLVIVPYLTSRSPKDFYRLLINEKVTILNQTPSAFRQLIDYAMIQDTRELQALRLVICAGEALEISMLEPWIDKYGETPKIVNMYGITETTVHVTYKIIGKKEVETAEGKSLIGRPIPDLQLYILDEDRQLLPVGVPGELYVGGRGLARGYLNREDLTLEKFIENPFLTQEKRKEKVLQREETRLYRTGDLVRYLSNGELEYLGRIDEQVKIRGYRIELGEISAVINQYANVVGSIVLARKAEADKNNCYLIACIAINLALAESLGLKLKKEEPTQKCCIWEGSNAGNLIEDIRNFLSVFLPDYMVPSHYVLLDVLPLTNNGKVDKKQLEGLASQLQGSRQEIEAPRTKLEIELCATWSEILGIDKIGIYDNFFRLGGHSLLAIQLISRIRTNFNIDFPLKVLFESPTIASLALTIESFSQNSVAAMPNMLSMNRPEFMPLSFAQERLWFIERYSEGTNAYNIPAVYKISNNAQVEVLELSIKRIISRHEILRTLIKEDDNGNAYQLVMNDKEHPQEIAKKVVTSDIQLDKELEKQANHVYDLSSEYPIRVCFYELRDNMKNNIEHYLCIVIHHIAFDGWSIDIFLNELQLFYNDYCTQSQSLKTTLKLPALDVQYKDFALWQRNYLVGEILDAQLNYWKEKLSDYKILNLVTDKPRPIKVSYEGEYLYFELDEHISRSLRDLSKELGISLYSLLLAGYYLMLRAYSNQDDIIVGTPVANRHYSQIGDLIGFFVNSLALRIKIDPKISIVEFIKQVWGNVVEAQSYQDLPFEKLVEAIEIEKDTSRHPVFQVQFGVQSFGAAMNSQSSAPSHLAKLLQPYVIEGKLYKVSQFDIITFIDDSQNKLTGSFSYATSLYTENTVKGFIETYITILKQIAELSNNMQNQEESKITSLRYLSESQYNQIINIWNQTDKTFLDEKTIHVLFEEQVKLTPDNIAVTYKNVKLTYQQLNKKANQLAHYLKQIYKIVPNTLVVLCLDRSEYMLISILAVLKAGGAYVPVDPSYPEERIQYILLDADATLVLTNVTYKEKLDASTKINKKIETFLVDDDKMQEHLKTQAITNPNTTTEGNNVAYVIYTSGTTGKPKGILMPHQVILKLIAWEKEDSCSLPLRIAQFASISFDVSLQEISYALLNGHELVIIPEDMKLSFNKLVQFIDVQQVNRLYFPSTALSVLAEGIISQNVSLKNLTTIIVSGEELIITSSISDCFKQRSWMTLINHYGPSETHLVSSYILPKSVGQWDLLPSIGKPIDNTQFYILDSNLTPLPMGAIGELYIGGVGLAKGYLNRQKLTDEKFVANPFQSKSEKLQNKNTRLYKSGDLVRWSPEGNLVYVGRNDHQVKIRGYRIELGEIESVLTSYEGIKQSVVLAKEYTAAHKISSSSNKYLVGYYVAEAKLNEKDILNYLQSKLLEYMVPNILIHLESLPLTINGKLDKKALPTPELSSEENYIPPRNDLEKKMCQIWTEVLGLPKDRIGVCDDFFRLGGNSILAIRLVSIINKYYKSNLKISDIFVYKTIELLLSQLVQTKNSYQTIIKLNNIYDKPNMFMIHPGEAGCEVYTSLAHRLSSDFSCYGIDSYNLYHENKITTLRELAEYYLLHIDQIMSETKQDTYHLIGWSLGGVLSLEIACILEKRGYNKIKVYLLDAIIEDEYLSSLMDTINIEDAKEAYRTYQLSRGYGKEYIEKIIALVNVERYLIRINQISSTLNKTKVLLFKAMLQDINDISFQTPKAEEIHQRISALKYNNVDKIVKNKFNLKLIRVSDIYHKNILEKVELITSEIEFFNRHVVKQSGATLEVQEIVDI